MRIYLLEFSVISELENLKKIMRNKESKFQLIYQWKDASNIYLYGYMDLYNTTQTWNFNNVFGLTKKKKEKKKSL